MMNYFNKCRLVKETCEWVVAKSHHVRIDQAGFERAEGILSKNFGDFPPPPVEGATDEEYLTYLFALDGLNFCFWPTEGLECEDLSQACKRAVVSKFFSVPGLCAMSSQQLAEKVFERNDIPLIEERAKILRELGQVVQSQFGSSFTNVVKSANMSAVELLNILTNNFPNFQDHAIYNGHQIHFYKRAQLLIRHIYGYFHAKGLGEFTDIEELTMFADYRVPQCLTLWGIFVYSPELRGIIESKKEIPAGSAQEVEIRAATVVAVEQFKQYLKKRHNRSFKSIEIDWFMWEYGETHLKELPLHHRTLSICY